MKDEYALALIAVLFGALLSSSGFLYRASREQKKLLNSVLYHLLEIWYAVRVSATIDTTRIRQILLDAVQRNFPDVVISESDKAEVDKMIAPIMSNLIQSFEISSLNPGYYKAIEQLSVEEPVLAFELSGNKDLKTLLMHIDTLMSEVSQVDADEKAKKIADKSREWLSEHIHQEAINDLSRDIKRIARRVGISRWLKVSLKLRKSSKKAESELTKTIDKFLDEFFAVLKHPPTTA